MKNFNCNAYQAYHHPYNTPQPPHHHQHHHQHHHHQHHQQHLLHHPYQHHPHYNRQQLAPLQLQQIASPHPPPPPSAAQQYQPQQPTAACNNNVALSSNAQMSSLTAAANCSQQNQYNNPNYTNFNNHNNHLIPFTNHNNNQHGNQTTLPATNQRNMPNPSPSLQLQLQLQPPLQQPRVHQRLEEVAAAPNPNSEKFTMDACEIANFLANELFMQQLVSVDGIQSGVPTLTTSTLTPTTLQSIEETFTQLISEPINAPYQAGFIPPSFPSTSTTLTSATFNGSNQEYNDAIDSESDDSQGSWNNANLNEDNSLATTDNSSGATDSTSFQNGLNGMGNSLATSNASSTNDFTNIAIAAAAAAAKNGGIITANSNNTSNSATPAPTRRNQGGRRPNKATNMTPEEEEKRRVRRQRNKEAAARCRKRRVDQTNELLEEVALLEKKREGLQCEIEQLNTSKTELEFIFEAHRPTCQKIRNDLMSVSTYGGLIAPTTNSGAVHTTSSGGGSNRNITGLDTTLASTGRSVSPLDLKPVISDNLLDVHIKHEPLDSALDNSSLEHDDGPPSPKRILLSKHNPMIPPPLPKIATLSASLAAAASASLNTPIVTTAPISFGSFCSNNATLNALNTLSKPHLNKQRPNTLPTNPRTLAQSLGLSVDGRPPTDINGVAIQTPSTGMFNFDSLMDGGTGLTPVSGPLVPTCSSQNKHPLELTTPTSEPSKLVSL